MAELHHFVRIDFHRFKAFDRFILHVRPFNILIGPNNAGKSTVLAAFRILAAALRRATRRKSELVPGPKGKTRGYIVDLSSISVAEENIFHNYNDSEPATVTFTLSNKHELLLFFPEQGSCFLIPDAHGRRVDSAATFNSQFNCSIGFVPILGPVEHNENLFEKEAARLALFNYRAARNFRNIWYHYPERFEEFREAVRQTWPGMDIEKPVIDTSYGKPRLHMFCPEDRIPREIFWAGFGFQVWCQMLTHLIQFRDAALFLIDEPDIYLHSDLQRQLLGLLRNMGPDIILATHSTEIIVEAEPEDLVLINKRRQTAKRIQHPSQLHDVFATLGSNINPILTQLAKTRRVLFVEGKDFQIVARFARKLRLDAVGSRRDFAVVPVGGFSPDRIRTLRTGMEATLGVRIRAAAILDRDYRSDAECTEIARECAKFCDHVTIHKRKEVENFLLVPTAIDRAARQRIADQAKRTGVARIYELTAAEMLDRFARDCEDDVTSQYLAARKRFVRSHSPGMHEASIDKMMLTEFRQGWSNPATRLLVVPGKEALSNFNGKLQEQYGVAVTPTAIVDAMTINEIPQDMKDLLSNIAAFAALRPEPGQVATLG